MRSFIKSHRRNESSGSEGGEDLDHSTLLMGINKGSPGIKPANSTKSNKSNMSIVSNISVNKTPMHSPNVANSGQFTPPPLSVTTRPSVTTPLSSIQPNVSISGSGGSAMSSPKKLLTPIKNLFSSEGKEKRKMKSHHKRSYSHGSISMSLSSSNSDLYGMNFKDPAKEYTSQTQSPQLPQSPQLSQIALQVPHPHSQQVPVSITQHPLISQTSLQPPLQPPPQVPKVRPQGNRKSRNPFSHSNPKPPATKPYTLHLLAQSKTSSISATSAAAAAAAAAMAQASKSRNNSLIPKQTTAILPKLKPPINLPAPKLDNGSNASLGNNSEKLVSFTADKAEEIKPEVNEDASIFEDYDDDDSSSSQFSFVKDRRGGRNTSVKYYKTPKEPESDDAQNIFNENDLGYEVDEFSDYDFENNGMDDDDGDEEDVKYNEMFDDDRSLKNPEEVVFNDESFKIPEDYLYADGPSEAQVQEISTTENLPGMGIQGDFLNSENSFNLETVYQSTFNDKLNGEEYKEKTVNVEGSSSLHACKENTFNEDADTLNDFKENTFNVKGITVQSFEDDYNKDALEALNGGIIPTNINESPSNGTDDTYTFGENPLPEVRIQELDKENSFLHEPLTLNGVTRTQSGGFDDEHPNAVIYEDDILENYLYFSKSPSIKYLSRNSAHENSSNDSSLSDQLELFEIETPTINSLTLGTSLNRRPSTMDSSHNEDETEETIVQRFEPVLEEESKVNPRQSINLLMNMLSTLETQTPPEEAIGQTRDEVIETTMQLMEHGNGEIVHSKTAQRLSILNMMSLLSNLERSQAEIVEVSKQALEKAEMNRRSIIDMMSTLSSLETTKSENKRNSINNIIQSISKLDLSKQIVKKKNHLNRLKEEEPRLSWFNNDETIFTTPSELVVSSISSPANEIINPPAIPQFTTDSDSEALDEAYKDVSYDRALDQELIDEINQIPEDFDFEEHHYTSKYLRDRPEFYRSNSYYKKPLKNLIDSKHQANKIETQNKTVTFYRTNSNGANSSLEVARSRSVSRAPSMRSMNSFVSEEHLMEEEEENEEPQTTESKSREKDDYRKAPHFKLNMNPNFNINDSGPKSPTKSLNKSVESRLRNRVMN